MTKVYRETILPDGSHVKSYRTDEGLWETTVSHPYRKTLETYNFQGLEQCLDHHDYLVEHEATYTAEDKPDRFHQIEVELNEEK